MGEPPVDNDECANCHRRAAAGEPSYKRCGKCKNAYYCSRDCQVGHWRVHKTKCQSTQDSKALASASGQKRELRLLQEWKRQVKNGGILSYMLLNFFGWNRLSSLQEDQSVIHLTLQFDFNKRNFVPTNEPSIVPINALEQSAQDLRQCYASFAPLTAGHCNIVILLQAMGMENIGTIVPYTMEQPTAALASASWVQLQMLLNEVTLESSKFDCWPPLLQQNLKTSIQSSVVEHPQFHPFLTNALRIESTNSRHRTHIVIINMEMGYGLGEIKRLESHSVDPALELISKLEQACGDVGARQKLDLENNPGLVASRRQYPHNCYMPVVFFCQRTKVLFIAPNLMEVHPGHNIYPVKQCDKKAKAAFAKLQKIKFPSVMSPELH